MAESGQPPSGNKCNYFSYIRIMDSGYIFRKLSLGEIPELIRLIEERIAWMDENGLHQWNETHYLERFPVGYFESEQQQGHVYGLFDAVSGALVCAGVMPESDFRWDEYDAEQAGKFEAKLSDCDTARAESQAGKRAEYDVGCAEVHVENRAELQEANADAKKAVYLHNLASSVTCRGAGSIFLEEAEKEAKRLGYNVFRLDSAVGNSNLTAYYESRGYLPKGECIHGLYHGILREKDLDL